MFKEKITFISTIHFSLNFFYAFCLSKRSFKDQFNTKTVPNYYIGDFEKGKDLICMFKEKITFISTIHFSLNFFYAFCLSKRSFKDQFNTKTVIGEPFNNHKDCCIIMYHGNQDLPML